MVNSSKYWSIFEQTGSIRDYLNYTACTSEGDLKTEKEIKNDRFDQCDRDRISNHANRGL